ncbi:tripartite ATP-independent transporter solute receptor, DctP family [Noviherbaspirillum humi]|uniref:Tripartite ATP-independent transporter solute receptor, DctP family n=1 Tax=Noviherbaspirillum humi TaxID=1688639 RepID=A0A239C345_9BURK|nr:TRAP transporter substrate-binding protein [Noviherbaspirillum humi]SNS14715.1 tripartite ATP-independent transporter solute receptor, DctP family [Noviherbaspirillum humi]
MKLRFNWIAAPALAAAFIAAPLAAHAKDFRSADVHPNDYPTVKAVTQLGKSLAEQTKGRLGIKVFANSSMGSEKDTLEQVKIGALDMARINIAALHAVSPAMAVPSLPFLFRSTEHMRAALDGPVGDEILAALEKEGFIGLAFYDSGARSFYTTKKPIRTLADMKGLKIRVQQSEMWVAMMQALGANATPMPFAEVYTALKTGLVDGAENNWPSYESSRHYEAAKYYSLTDHSLAPEVLVFSKKVWDGLSKEDQQLIRKAAKESVPVMRKLWDEREAKSRQVVTAAGVQIVSDVDKQAFSNAMKPVYDKFITDPMQKDLVAKIQKIK